RTPAWQQIAVVMRPIRCVGLSSQCQQLLTLVVISNAIQGEQSGHVARMEPDPTALHTADLGVRRPDRVTRHLDGNTTGLAQPAQLSTQQNAYHGGPPSLAVRDALPMHVHARAAAAKHPCSCRLL